MEGYMGETELEIEKTKYALYSKEAWVMLFIEMYSGIDGSEHKDWIIDQISRILKGTKVKISLAKWAYRRKILIGRTINRILEMGKRYEKWQRWC